MLGLDFAPAVAYGSVGWEAFSVAVPDVNGDGKPDLVVADLCASYNSGCIGTGTLGVLIRVKLESLPILSAAQVHQKVFYQTQDTVGRESVWLSARAVSLILFVCPLKVGDSLSFVRVIDQMKNPKPKMSMAA